MTFWCKKRPVFAVQQKKEEAQTQMERNCEFHAFNHQHLVKVDVKCQSMKNQQPI